MRNMSSFKSMIVSCYHMSCQSLNLILNGENNKYNFDYRKWKQVLLMKLKSETILCSSLICLLACADTTEKEVVKEISLMEASHQVIFASVEKLGKHDFQATYQQQEFHGEEEKAKHEEILEIKWQDWDHFQSRRSVDGEVASNVIISDLGTWDWHGGKWVERSDGEPYRVQMRNTWNQWDSVIRHFSEHIEWVLDGEEVIEERKTKRYKAKFTKPETVKSSLRPTQFQGTVWVDEETAVRVLGEIRGSLVRNSYRKVVKLQVQRTEIGKEKKMVVPIQQ
jgi:hypothetical protein